MANSIAGGGRSAKRVADVHVVALYDPASGHIWHLHTVTVFEGGRHVSEEEAVAKAKELAKKQGHPVDRLHVKTAKDAAFARRPHRIDVRSGKFVLLTARPG